MDAEIEMEDDYKVPQINKPEGAASFFYKLLVAALLFATYFLLQRFSAAIGARVARRTIAANERNYDEEMQEARRRLQERFDAERRKHEKMKKDGEASNSTSNDLNTQTETQNTAKRIKPPKAELLRSSGEYFPLMGGTGGSSRACLRRSRNTGG